MRTTQGTPVQIFGQVYRLKSNEDPDRVRRLAELVDRKMSHIADRGGSADNYRVAVLAALELAEELTRQRESRLEMQRRVESTSVSLEAILNGEAADDDSNDLELNPAAD